MPLTWPRVCPCVEPGTVQINGRAHVTMRTPALRAICTAAMLMGIGNWTAARAQQSGAAPANLRVTGVTDWAVSLAWNAPKGKTPSHYVVQCTNGRTETVAASQTTTTFTSG